MLFNNKLVKTKSLLFGVKGIEREERFSSTHSKLGIIW
jgi:hypothetical protein